MNKNLFKTFAIAAMAVLAGACAKENEQLAGPSNVTFEISTPEIATKAIGDGMTATKLYYQVFDADGKVIEGLGVQNKDLVSGKTTVSFQLVKDQTYNFIFWAQTAEAGYYTIDATEGLKKITADYLTHKGANDENRDAFFAVEKSLKITGPVSKNIELKRPFAQVNIATVGSYKVGEKEKAIDFSEAKSSVKIVYIPTEFSPLAEKQVSKTKTTTFATAEIPEGNITVEGKSYKYMAMNYIFASEEGSVYDITATLKVGGTNYTVTIPNAPLKRNWRTNIVGDFLTTSAEFNVVVVPGFETETADMDLNNPKNETELAAAMATFGQVTVSNDIKFSTSMSSKSKSTLTIESDASLAPAAGFRPDVSELIFVGGGELTLDGDGTVVGPSNSTYGNGSQAILVQGGSVNIKGNLKVEGGSGSVGNHAVTITDGAANIYGGHFHAGLGKDGQSSELIYMRPAWRKKAELNIYGGVFEMDGDPGFLINIKADAIARSTVAVYGGTFVGFNPADNNADGEHTNYVAEGYRAIETTYEGKQAWKVEAIPAVTTQEALNTAIAEANATVVLAAGTYKLPKETVTVDGKEKSVIAEGVTIIGNGEGTVLNTEAAEKGGEGNYNAKCLNNVTFKNLTINEGQGNYNGIKHSGNIKYEKCVILGRPTSYATNVEYKDCTFKQTTGDYNIWTYASNITFDNCVFDCQGKAAMVYREGNDATKDIYLKVTFNKCVFKASAKVTGKAAIEIDSSLAPYEVYINNCTSEGFDNGTKSGNSLWNNKKGDATNLKVVVDSVPQTLN